MASLPSKFQFVEGKKLRPLTHEMGDLFEGEEVRPYQSREEKAAFEKKNRARLERDLIEGRLIFDSRPFAIDMQISNFCNMSCIMCYDGENPPTKRMPDDLIALVASEILPSVSVLLPFSGSEPLLLGWDTTRRLAEKYGMELDIVTNVQYLDEKMLKEVEPLVGRIIFSIDSHIPEIYEAIRLRSNPKKVFENLPKAAKFFEENGIKVTCNVVLMSNNAAWVPETIAYMADQGIFSVHILGYLHNLPHQRMLDPKLTFKPEYLEYLKERSIAVAKEKKVELIWDLGGSHSFYDFREKRNYRNSIVMDHWDRKLKLYQPGYCIQSVYRVKVDNDGRIYPCCVADGGRLALGNLYQQSFEEIWNGPESQDLRRAMLCGDLPDLCKNCWFTTNKLAPESHLPFVDQVVEDVGFWPSSAEMEVNGPPHLARITEPPSFSWDAPPTPVDRYLLVCGMGGEAIFMETFEIDGQQNEFTIPKKRWKAFLTNKGYWWGLWAIKDGDSAHSYRSKELRCFIRHEDLPRIKGSSLYKT